MSASDSWQVLATTHKEKQLQNIPREWILDDFTVAELKGTGTNAEGRLIQLDAASQSGLLTQSELEITGTFTACDLVDKLARRELCSEDVVRAYCKRAALAQQLVCAQILPFFAFRFPRPLMIQADASPDKLSN